MPPQGISGGSGGATPPQVREVHSKRAMMKTGRGGGTPSLILLRLSDPKGSADFDPDKYCPSRACANEFVGHLLPPAERDQGALPFEYKMLAFEAIIGQ